MFLTAGFLFCFHRSDELAWVHFHFLIGFCIAIILVQRKIPVEWNVEGKCFRARAELTLVLTTVALLDSPTAEILPIKSSACGNSDGEEFEASA